jgi:hypothetical protein
MAEAAVACGELSANQAAIRAGFRKLVMQVRADDLDAAVRTLIRKHGRDAVTAALARAAG